MNKTAVVTDSNSGITRAEGEKAGVFVVPMPFLINGEQFYEEVSLTQEQFYAALQSDASLATSQPIVGELLEFWDEVLKKYDEILYIPMSGGLSESCNTAKMLAAQGYKNKVFVVDNQRISLTQKQSVFDAKKLIDGGMSASKVKEYLEKSKMDASIYISLPTLQYLKKGGRLTPAVAAVGTVLHLRPVLQIQGERLDKFRMTTVTMKQAKAAMVEGLRADLNGRFKKYVADGEMVIHVAHTQNEEKAKQFKSELQHLFPEIPVVWVDPLSLSVACHIGPGALACACVRTVR